MYSPSHAEAALRASLHILKCGGSQWTQTCLRLPDLRYFHYQRRPQYPALNLRILFCSSNAPFSVSFKNLHAFKYLCWNLCNIHWKQSIFLLYTANNQRYMVSDSFDEWQQLKMSACPACLKTVSSLGGWFPGRNQESVSREHSCSADVL